MKFYSGEEWYSLSENTNFLDKETWKELIEYLEMYTNKFLIPLKELIDKKMVVEVINGNEVEYSDKGSIKIMIDCNIETINFIRSQLSRIS